VEESVKEIPKSLRTEVLTAVEMSLLVFWSVRACGLVDRYHHVSDMYYLCLQGCRWRQYFSLKCYCNHNFCLCEITSALKESVEKIFGSKNEEARNGRYFK
jgi:hypothetical protein